MGESKETSGSALCLATCSSSSGSAGCSSSSTSSPKVPALPAPATYETSASSSSVAAIAEDDDEELYGTTPDSIGLGFRGAREADESALNEMSKPDASDAEFRHFAVSRVWMDEFATFLSCESDDSRPDIISSEALLTPPVSFKDPDQEDEALASGAASPLDGLLAPHNNHEKKHKSEDHDTPDFRILLHNLDFILVGENLWTLLSSKFGFDFEIYFRTTCRKSPSSNRSSLVVDLSTAATSNHLYSRIVSNSFHSEDIPLPPSNKWDYIQSHQTHQKQTSLHDPYDCLDISEDPGDSFINDDVSSNTKPPSQELAIVPLHTSNNYTNFPYVRTNNHLLRNQSLLKRTNKRKRYGSGLGNLGNTCFMNSTLQCLAHTGPLCRYFLTGEFETDLNRDNPLGTGGELALEFADLLSQMWGTTPKQSHNAPRHFAAPSYSHANSYYSHSYDQSVIYPRSFKLTLGRHAEQFVGYDQHDSQELATYLLDALHEDTNRVTKKPYVEKPEQREDETDDAAAAKAWQLHLKREDSRVLESFMGQVKSRVQCPRQNCGRVSTTFDPFMYLSVPIPGATDRTLIVTYVPFHPTYTMRKISITLNKTSTISALRKKIVDHLNEHQQFDRQHGTDRIHDEDICIVDVLGNEVYSFYALDNEIDGIRDSDGTYAYHLRSLSSIKADNEAFPLDHDTLEPHDDKSQIVEITANLLPKPVKCSLDRDEEWRWKMQGFLVQMTTLDSICNAKRTHQERISFFNKAASFIRLCRDSSDFDGGDDDDDDSDDYDEKKELLERNVTDNDFDLDQSETTIADHSSASPIFKNIRTSRDLAVFAYYCMKFREYSIGLEKERKDAIKDGVIVQIVPKMRPSYGIKTNFDVHTGYGYGYGFQRPFATPIVMRISPHETVHGLRNLVADRMSGALRLGQKSTESRDSDSAVLSSSGAKYHRVDDTETKSGDESFETSSPANDEQQDESLIDDNDDNVESESDETEDTEARKLFRKVYASFSRHIPSYYYSRGHNASFSLGSIVKKKDGTFGTKAGETSAVEDDDAEKCLVAEKVGQLATISMNFPPEFSDDMFDGHKWETVEDLESPSKAEEENESNTLSSKKTTVLDCISKYCQMEQLEESEMWYCNRCKEHVRAWKQFHLYRTPPVLIVHLKRFQFSASTHRRDKIDTFIDFPLKGLDLTNEVMHWNEGEEPIYDCYAVSNHYGGLGGGHYTAYAQSDDGVWCHFDDSRVTTGVDKEETKTNAAYVLYYRRRDVAVSFDLEEKQKLKSKQQSSPTKEEDMETDDADAASSRTSSSQLDIEGDYMSTEDEGTERDNPQAQ